MKEVGLLVSANVVKLQGIAPCGQRYQKLIYRKAQWIGCASLTSTDAAAEPIASLSHDLSSL